MLSWLFPTEGGDWVFAVTFIPSPDLSDGLKRRASNVGCSHLVLPVYNISRLYADILLTGFTWKFEPIFAQDDKVKYYITMTQMALFLYSLKIFSRFLDFDISSTGDIILWITSQT